MTSGTDAFVGQFEVILTGEIRTNFAVHLI
jgi:hypothetical protein